MTRAKTAQRAIRVPVWNVGIVLIVQEPYMTAGVSPMRAAEKEQLAGANIRAVVVKVCIVGIMAAVSSTARAIRVQRQLIR